MKIYENKILRILGFIFIWIYVFGVGICFAGRWYAIGIPGVVLLLVWLNHNLIGAAIRRYRARQAIKQIKKHGTRLSDLCKSLPLHNIAIAFPMKLFPSKLHHCEMFLSFLCMGWCTSRCILQWTLLVHYDKCQETKSR